MSDYHRILSRLYNVPLAISQDKLDILSSQVTIKLLAGQTLSREVATPTVKATPDTEDKVAIIKVFDSLVSKGGAGESGFTSYESITRDIKSAIAAGVNKIGFYIDSPGGEAFGVFPLADFISNLPSVYGIETFAFTDGGMNSAAYAIGSAAQKLYAVESSTIGSIGTIMALIDVTKADEKAGYNYTILRSKEGKAIYNPHESINQEVIDKYTGMLEELDTIFNNNVSKYRPKLSVQDIIAMNGESFLATKALELNLIDSIVASFDEVLKTEVKSSSSLNKPRGNIMTLEEIKAQLAAKEQELATLQAQVTGTVAKAITDERARCVDILTAGNILKMSADQISKRISSGTSKEDSLDIFTAIAEAVGSASAIDTSTGIEATVSKETIIGANTKIEIAGSATTMSEIIAAAQAQTKGAK